MVGRLHGVIIDCPDELLDQIGLPPATADRLIGAGIGRRTHLTGDGSDHDPVWVDLDL